MRVSQHEPHIEHVVRSSDYRWLVTKTFDLQGAAHLPAIDYTLALADVDAGVFPCRLSE